MTQDLEKPGTSGPNPVDADNLEHFECSVCSVRAPYDYYGRTPPYAQAFRFKEDVYVTRNPFQPHDKKDATRFIVLGGVCAVCERSVCADTSTCSIYYGQRLCRICALQNIHRYPDMIQEEIKKMKTPPTVATQNKMNDT